MADEKKYWLDDPNNVNKIFWGLTAICLLLLLPDLGDLLHIGPYHKHTHFRWEKWFGFFGFFGFIASIGLIMAARQLRNLLGREEDYYDR